LPLRQLASDLENEWGQKIAEMLVRLIEEPGFRLAGADAGIRQVAHLIEQALQTQERLAQPLVTTSEDSYRRLKALLDCGRQKKSSPVDDIELLRLYSEARLQRLVNRQVWASFITLRSNLAEVARDVGYCRNRLGDLLQRLATPGVPGERSGVPLQQQQPLTGEGNQLNEAIEEFFARLTTDATGEWERVAQTSIESRFHSLTNTALKEPGNLANLEAVLLEAALVYVCARLPLTDAASSFLRTTRQATSAEQAFREVVEKATPWAAKGRDSQTGEICIVAAPPGSAGDEFRDLAVRALPGAESLTTPDNDEVVVCRELANLPLDELELLGPSGQAIHAELNAAKGVTAHSRWDVDFRLARA
jgi:hypothetical protein